jgi:hypothetical protein
MVMVIGLDMGRVSTEDLHQRSYGANVRRPFLTYGRVNVTSSTEDAMTDYAMPHAFQPTRKPARPGRPTGVLGAISYAGVLLVWGALFWSTALWP